MIEVCGLSKMVKRPVGYLSKGYRQRVGLAQAMIHEPELLILDEPISGLDPNQIVEIRELIKNIGKQKTVIYCSHILSEVEATCDRLLIINRGKLVAQGTSKEVTDAFNKNNGFYVRGVGDTESFMKKIGSYKEVISINQLQDSIPSFDIVTNSDEAFGEVIFETAHKENFKIREIVHKRTTLEDVFTELTGGIK